MNSKKYLQYAGVFTLALVISLVFVGVLSDRQGSLDPWGSIDASVKQIGVDSDLAATTAIANKDKVACIVSKSVSGLAGGVAESAASVKGGTCRILDVNVDVAACLGDMTPVVLPDPVVEGGVATAPVAEAPVAEAPVAEAPVAEAPVVEAPVVEAPVVEAPVVEAPVATAADTDVSTTVEQALSPLVSVVQGVLKNEASATEKMWATGVLAWLDAGRQSIIELIENPPAEGKFLLKGVDIEGCTP